VAHSLAIGLVFAITAIPVLYLYLRHIDYPTAATRRWVNAIPHRPDLLDAVRPLLKAVCI
jgi:hypothetical protein